METAAIQAVRGTRDVLPPRRAAEWALEVRLQEVFSLYGYELIETPVLEPTELFLRKHGETIAARMYSFSHWNRQLCLRPEFTASVIRAYVNHLQDQPLPLRLQYSGPTFRYERPQQARHRQWTEVGAECIGAEGPPADAEVLAMARHGVEAAGVRKGRFVVGHLGAVLGLLGQLGMEARTQALVVAEMEHLARAPTETAQVVERLTAMLTGGGDAQDEGALAILLQSFGPEAATRITSELLERAQLSLDGGARTAEEIVERLLRKSHRADPTAGLARAMEFIQRLRELAGPPDQALPGLRQLLARFGLNDGPVVEVERALEGFGAYFPTPIAIDVDLALARGLRYYTGLVFEVYDGDGNQLAGGGRYDDLVRSLGGRQAVPACGFGFGLERLAAAAEREGELPEGARPVKILVAPVAQEDYPMAAHLAAGLRGDGIPVEVDVRFRGVKNNLRHADRAGIPLVLILGERERAANVATLRDMAQFDETQVPVGTVTEIVRSRLGDKA